VNDTSVENERVIQVQDNTENRNVVYGLERIHEAGVLYLSDSYGSIIQHGTKTYAYTPYGELTEGTITGVNEAGYKGEVHDTESLHYLRARTYHTKYQVFLSEDTVVGCDTHPLSQNRYTFALNNPYKYSDPSGNVPQSFDDGNKQAKTPVGRQWTIQDEQAFQEAEVEQNIKNVQYTNEQKVPEEFNDIVIPIQYYDSNGLQQTLNQKTQDSINASKKIALDDSLNPYNYQPNISGNKDSNSKKGYNESTFINDGLNFLDERLSVIGDVLKSVSITSLAIAAVPIVVKAVELLGLIFAGGFAFASTVAASPLIVTLLTISMFSALGLMLVSKIQEYTSYTGETLGGDELSEEEAENRRIDGLDNSNTAFSLYMLGTTGIHINNALDTSIANVNENISNKAAAEEAAKVADTTQAAKGGSDSASQVSSEANALESGSELVLKGTNYSAEYAQKLKDTYKVFQKNGYEIGEHGLNRIFGRINQGKIESVDQVLDVLKTGTKYSDTVEGGTVIFKNGISIHIAEDGFIKSVIGEAKVKTTWEIIE